VKYATSKDLDARNRRIGDSRLLREGEQGRCPEWPPASLFDRWSSEALEIWETRVSDEREG